ncbi:MAG: hypothetical protein JO356_16870 [Acidobacteria bacterium]|nr:hypothetical protein [Acidobacteriota bacterium]
MNTNADIALAILIAMGVLVLLSLMGAYLVIGMAWDKSPLHNRREHGLAAAGWTLAGRALLLRCPRCGRGHIFRSRFHMNEACPACARLFWRNEGEWTGPGIIDFTFATISGLVAWAILLILGAGAALQLVIAILAALAAGVIVSRWSRSFWTLLLYISGEMDETISRAP